MASTACAPAEATGATKGTALLEMLRHFVLKPKTVNRLAIMGILPMMVLAILSARQSGAAESLPLEAPREGLLVVGNLRGESVTIHSLGGDGESRSLALAGAPHELVVAAGQVYATLPRQETIVEIDPRAPGVLRSVDAGPMVHGLALADSGTLVATLDDARAALTIDRATLETEQSDETGDTPHTVAVVDGRYFVTDARDGVLRRIDPATGESATVPAGTLPESVTVAGGRIVVADAVGGSIRWYTPDLELLGATYVGGAPVRVIRIDDDHVAAALNVDGKVAVVNLLTGDIERRFRVPGRPDGLCLSPSGRFLAVVSNEYDSVGLYRVEDWKVMLTLGAGDGPGSCAWL